MRLKDKVAIITGGASGIGLAACRRFVEEGAKVVLSDYDAEKGKEEAKKLQDEGYDVQFVQVDVANMKSVRELMDCTLNMYGRIDVLVNNAGITQDATLLKMTEEQFDRVIDVNLKGVFYCTKAVAPIMVEQGKGKIINTSSVVGVYGNFGPDELRRLQVCRHRHDENVGERIGTERNQCQCRRTWLYRDADGAKNAGKSARKNERERVARTVGRSERRGERLSFPGSMNRITSMAMCCMLMVES